MKHNSTTPNILLIVGFVITIPILLFLIYKLYFRITSTDIFLLEYIVFIVLGLLIFTVRNDDTKKEEFVVTKKWIDHHYLEIIFSVIFLLILLSLKNSIYIKPLSYYILVSLAWVVVGLQIIRFDGKSHWQLKLILFQIILLGAIIRFSSYIINPYLVGPDSYWHYNQITNILCLGHLNVSAGWYYHYPTFHLLNVIAGALVGFSENIFAVISLLLSTFILIPIYLIGTLIVGKKVGLMAALFMTISTPVLFLSIPPTHQSIGFLLLSIGIYVLIGFNKPERHKYRFESVIIFGFIAFSIFFVHPATSITFILILASNFLVKKITKNNNFVPLYAYIVGFVAYAIFVSNILFNKVVIMFFIPGETQSIPSVELQTTYFNSMEYLQYAFAYIGVTSFLLFGTYGVLKWLNRPTNEKLFIIITLFLLHFIPILSFVTGSGALEPGRMLVSIYFLLVFSVAYGWINIFQSVENNLPKLTGFIILAFLIAFFSTTSYIVWDDNEIFNDQVALAGGHLTQSAAFSHPYLNKIPEKSTILIDSRHFIYLTTSDRGPFDLKDREIIRTTNLNDSVNGSYFFLNIPRMESGLWKSLKEKETFLSLANEKNKIYNNGDTMILGN